MCVHTVAAYCSLSHLFTHTQSEHTLSTAAAWMTQPPVDTTGSVHNHWLCNRMWLQKPDFSMQSETTFSCVDL